MQDKTIDLVITSPPYLNAIDYIRCSKFSLVWIGHDVEDLRATRSEMIGAEVSAADSDVANEIIMAHGRLGQLPQRWRNVLAKYIHDIDKVLAETARVLVSGGRAVFVVGDSNLRGVYVRNSKIVSLLGQRHGLDVESISRRRLPDRLRYLPPPKTSGTSKSGLGARMRTEALVALRA